MGTSEYPALAETYHVPIVVTGFEPLDILEGIRRTVIQLEHLRLPLFIARGRKPLSESGFKAGWGRMMRAAVAAGVLTKDERFHFHDIRAKHASDREDDLAQLALGHTTPRMTAGYMRNPKGRRYPALDAPAAGGGDTAEMAEEA
ncbi:MAG: hypothetical protein ABR612_14585, partial [Chromatocurvus sp.]